MVMPMDDDISLFRSHQGSYMTASDYQYSEYHIMLHALWREHNDERVVQGVSEVERIINYIQIHDGLSYTKDYKVVMHDPPWSASPPPRLQPRSKARSPRRKSG